MEQRKRDARIMFARGHSADEWNDLYEAPASLDATHFVRRRDVVADYISGHVPTSASVLDLGCGAGVLTEILLERGFRVHAADISPDMLGLATRRLSRFEPGTYSLSEAEAERLPFPDASFDVVACVGLFGYLDEVDDALIEIRRVLKPGGLLILSVRNHLNRLVFDPVLLLTAPLRKIMGRLPRSRADGQETGPAATKPRFMIDIFDRPRNVIAGVCGQGYALGDFVGIGYGPPTLARRKLLPERWAIAFSGRLERALAAVGLQGLTCWLADISVYIFSVPPI